ncbi:hypothetical protein THAOC_09358 [Thalassiosira oceanica]|uniref:Uncharacterized protein n=1 Tax=Thalassiosira oceanica TaxID=159749 RepID=K0SSS0_THAOC|nr:hypothetical protein THAOC_09358 [Thalassiosira oceanica]|eukprot:EJK69393.1 hypothetical protein THAOC_09358 [Thalassiosira oceanica]
MGSGASDSRGTHTFKTKKPSKTQRVIVILGSSVPQSGILECRWHLLRRGAPKRNTATSLDVKLIGWGRTGSAEGRRTGRGLRRMPWEGGRSVWLGSACLTSDWNRAISISGVRGARCRITATSPAERGDVGADRRAAVRRRRAYTTIHGGWRCFCGSNLRGGRIRGEAGGRSAVWEPAMHRKGVDRRGAQPCVEDGHIRQYTAAGGAPVVQISEAVGYEARLEGVPLAGNWWCITKKAAEEGAHSLVAR